MPTRAGRFHARSGGARFSKCARKETPKAESTTGNAEQNNETLWGQSPKPEGRRPKSRKAGRNPKPETQNRSGAGLSFGFRASGFFRISDFDLRIYAVPTTCVFV